MRQIFTDYKTPHLHDVQTLGCAQIFAIGGSLLEGTLFNRLVLFTRCLDAVAVL